MSPSENTTATVALAIQTMSLVIQTLTLAVALVGFLGNPTSDMLPLGR